MIPILDLKAQYATIKAELDAAVADVLSSTVYILGPYGKRLEAGVAAYTGTAHGVGVASGTDALRLCLHALGVKPGDEVITTPFTFVASANTISRAGATPVFVDIDPRTFNLDPELLEAAITERTVGIVPVHLYGQSCDMPAILDVARRHNLWVLEDMAQAIGATWAGKPAGTWGAAGCISFYPTKNLGAAGDAGMVVTDDDALYEQVELLRRHGGKDKYNVHMVGYNSRLDELQAAVLTVKLARLAEWTAARQRVAARYDAGFADLPVETPHVAPQANHVYHQYTLRAPQRDALVEHLAARGVGSMLYYPYPLHRQAIYADLGYGEGSLPHSEAAGHEVVSLPIYPELSEAQIDEVIAAVRGFYER
ncbi:MAG TPA: DegT/DnrJ/EryC1/StrS family aminotransferase [Herpetosiphonaceae bacterium]